MLSTKRSTIATRQKSEKRVRQEILQAWYNSFYYYFVDKKQTLTMYSEKLPYLKYPTAWPMGTSLHFSPVDTTSPIPY